MAALQQIAIQLLRELRRNVRDDDSIVAFILQLEHMPDPVNFGQ
jgi:hypothetical protein